MLMQRLWWGLLAGVLALMLFAVLAWQVRRHDSPVWDFDRRCAVAMQENAAEHPERLDLFRILTHAGGVPAMMALAGTGALVLWIAKQRRLAVLWLLIAALGAGINLTAKSLIDRPRPPEGLRDSAVTEHNASYPSGHAMGSVIGYGLLAYVSVVLLPRRDVKVLVVGLLLALVLTIGLSRVYLRAHWYSDVVGGFAIGMGVLTICLILGDRRK